MSIDSCYADISKFSSMRANLESVVANINVAVNKISPVTSTIYSLYSVNDNNTPIISRCNSVKKDMAETAKFINNTVIPAIDAAIRGRRNQIARLEEQARQEAERKRKEEEEKRAREEAEKNRK